jgi:cell division protein FtsB
MGLFKKKPDPLSERARDLNAELAALEAEIKQLSTQRDALETQPKLRSTATRGQHTVEGRSLHSAPVPQPPPPAEPIFEEVNQERVKAAAEPAAAAHFNELGGRKFDLAAAWRRWLDHFRGRTASNPRLINYLAAGSIQGLRPLRYERRVARNRFLLLTLFLLVVLWGLFAYFLRR